MEIQVKERAPGQWIICVVAAVGESDGRTTYSSPGEAEKVARSQHPDKKIRVIG